MMTAVAGEVQTALGLTPVASLGPTLMHEHLFVLSREILDNMPGLWDEERYVAQAVAELQKLHSAGIRTIVDPTIIGLGRFVPRIHRVAEQVEVNIIVGTGVYAFAEMPHFFRYRGPGTMMGGAEPITEMLVRDIRKGIAGTDIRAGFIKVATDAEGITPDVARIMRATVDAHLETGAPILTHSHAESRSGKAQQDFFAERGVDLTRVVIGHVGDTTDLDYLMELADAGSILGMDRFGYSPILDTESRIDTVRRLVERGYADRMVLSHDNGCFSDLFPPEDRAVHLPELSYLLVSTKVIPQLLDQGVTQGQIDQMLVTNPARFFAPAA